jgi:thioredoxin-related protein
MKRISTSLLLASAIGLVAFSIATDPLAIGSPIPKADHKLTDINGKETSLKSSMKENGLLVMFSCNTCPVVINHQSRTKAIAEYALSKNVGIILLNANEGARNGDESMDAMKAYAKEQGYNFTYAVDKNSELADAFGAVRTPECFLFDKSGKLVYHGAIDDNPQDAGNVSREHLKEAINESVGGKEVTVKKSRSVGCSIKRS